MRLAAALSPDETEGPDDLFDGMPGDGLLASVQGDPIGAQTALYDALTQFVRDDEPEISQLDALLALDRQAESVIELLMTQYVEGDGQIGSLEWKAWHSALRLSQALFQAYGYFLDHIQQTSDDEWTEEEPLVQIKLFHHRKVEFLLRFVRYKKRSSELWKQLHAMYRLARERHLLDRPGEIGATDGEPRFIGELEQQYVQILLLEAINNGRFSPREALWAQGWFSRWCSGPDLQLTEIKAKFYVEPKGFVVDLGGSDGLVRAPVQGESLLYFDSSPLSAMIDQAIASLRDGAAQPYGPTAAVRAGQLALLDKLANTFAPNPVDIERRAERKPIAQAVQAIVGFPYIVDELRKEGISSAAVPETSDNISPVGGPDFSFMFPGNGDASPISLSSPGSSDVMLQVWQVKDRSDSGCRMRGQIGNLSGVIPGSLIAVRDNQAAPWIVSVVRWFRRLMVDYVEIGVEFLGREPRFVKVVTDSGPQVAIPGAPNLAWRCFAALYLPPSEEYPTMPIKTLLLPAREFRTDCDVTLLTSNATWRMRLSEPIQQQFEYVLTSFAVIDKAAPLPAGLQ